MNAIVEVATAKVVAQTEKVVVSSYVVIDTAIYIAKVMTQVVVTSTLRVLSLGGHSLSAVAPDFNINFGGTAEAA
jgi:hypothetical protein